MNEQVELLNDEKKDLEESVTYKDNEIEVIIIIIFIRANNHVLREK